MLLVRDLKDRFDEGELVDLYKDDLDVHSVASLLKQYFRELPESIIPFASYQEFMNIAMRFQGSSKLDEVEELRNAMAALPQDNYNVLKFLCSFLDLVAQKTDVNKMSAENLARVFGPNIIRHPQMDDNPEVFMLTTADISEQLAYMLINYHDKIFTIEFDSGRKSANVAVDDLLRMDSVEISSTLLPPISQQSETTLKDLSTINFEQRADRRARTFHNTTFDEAMADQQELESSGDKNESVNKNYSMPRSELFTKEGKPIPPMRKKQLRKKTSPDLDHIRSNDSVSSDNSEYSEYSSDGVSKEFGVHRNSLRNSIGSGVNEPNTQLIELQQKLDTKVAEYNSLLNKYENLNASKAKADSRVRDLNEERRKMQERYESHIKTLEARHKQQLDEAYKKLDNEKTSRAEAVQKIMDLQKLLQNYQMTFGDITDRLPPLYHAS